MNEISRRTFSAIAAGLWQSQDGVLISENSTSTMWSVEAPGHKIRDFFTTAEAMKYATEVELP